jgi:23S rRNA (uracil1939-C5)-methyltransferase
LISAHRQSSPAGIRVEPLATRYNTICVNPTIETSQVQVSAMTFGPCAIARVGGKSVMIPAAVPGDVLEIETQSHKRDYAFGCVVRVIQPAPERRTPPCPYAARCGGCDWQHIRYEAQARLKAEMLAAEFRRRLGVELDHDGLVEPAPAEFHYRSRVRLKTGPEGQVGFHHGRSNSFVGIEDCLVAAPPISRAARLARELGRNCTEIEVVAAREGDVLVAHLIKAPRAFERAVAHQMIDNGTAGLILRSGAVREVLGDARIACEVEPSCVIEADADLFSQVNREQNVKLVAAVMRLAEIGSGARVLDVFCGTGNFSLPAARRSRSVIGLDRDGLAIDAARANAERMGLKGTQFIATGAAEGLRFLLQTSYRADVLILDPPRAGAAYIIEAIARLKSRRLIYVSCNLPTLVRDLHQLILRGYKVGGVRAFDFFPNTHHLEIVASLLLT